MNDSQKGNVMATMEFLCRLAGVDPADLSKEENIILEADLFVHLCDALVDSFKASHLDYSKLIKVENTMGDFLMDSSLVRCLINDILSTQEYTLDGIAYYSNVPEDVIYELVIGKITNPSAFILRKIMELHRSVRRELYEAITKKIISKSTLFAK